MTTAERLLDLLPEIFRTRDAAAAAQIAARLGLPAPSVDGSPEGPLTSLLVILGQTFEVLEAEVDNLYDDLFIETCAPWLVPYLGELVGARIVDTGDTESARRQVATTIAARRSKGTARALALRSGAIMDAPTEAVEYFPHLVTALHLDFPGEGRAMSAALNGTAGRRSRLPDHIGQHTVELREISAGGRFAPSNIGIRTWTTRSLRHAETTPRPVPEVGPGHFRFAPTGADVALWRLPRADRPEETRLTLPEVPGPIPLVDAVGVGPEDDGAGSYYGPGLSLTVRIDGVLQPLAAICFCDLGDAPGGGWNRHGGAQDHNRIRIDPARGRLRLPDAAVGTPAERIRVMYHYGAAVDVGGGGYATAVPFQTDVPEAPGPDPASIPVPFAVTRATVAASLTGALDDLGGRSEIRVEDGGMTDLPSTTELPEAAQVRLCADDGTWPTLVAEPGGWRLTGGQGTILVIRGLRLVGGPLVVDTEGLERLRLIDCTLLPGRLLTPEGAAADPGAVMLDLRQPGVEVEATRCCVGRVVLEETARLTLVDCLVDPGGLDGFAISGPGGSPAGVLAAERSTILGGVALRMLDVVSDCVVARRPAAPPGVTMTVSRLQEGCARFSAFPAGAVVPGQYRCYPHHPTAPARGPDFASLSPADPEYGTLLPSSPPEILAGAEGGREMGVTNATSWSRRRMLLARDFPDWTPFAMQSGVEPTNRGESP